MVDAEPIIVDLRRERLADTSDLTFEHRFLAGAELFDYACEIAKSSVKIQHADWSEEQVLSEVRHRMMIAQRLRERR